MTRNPVPEFFGEEVRVLPIQLIRKDGGTQHRTAINSSKVFEYSALMREHVAFPPITVWWDGKVYWLSDGFHRLAASELIGQTEIQCSVRHGTIEDARWDSYAANADHGIRRTSGDVQKILALALKHPNAKELSNVQPARHLRIPEPTLRRWRRRLSSSLDEDTTRLVTRGDSTYFQHTQNIGRNPRQPTAKSRDQLRQELADMKNNASPNAKRLLNTLSNWVFGNATPESTLNALEVIIRSGLK